MERHRNPNRTLKWQRLIHERCPACEEKLEYKGKIFRCPNCDFVINAWRYAEILIDESHPMRQYLNNQERDHLERAIAQVLKETA